MVVGLFIGMSVVIVILFTVMYVELVRVWKDVDRLRREIHGMRKEFDRHHVRTGGQE